MSKTNLLRKSYQFGKKLKAQKVYGAYYRNAQGKLIPRRNQHFYINIPAGKKVDKAISFMDEAKRRPIATSTIISGAIGAGTIGLASTGKRRQKNG